MLDHIDPATLLAELDARHVYDLGHREQELLGDLWFGYAPEQVAMRQDCAAATVRRWYVDLERRVLDFTEVPACACYLRTWTCRHLDCCASYLWSVLVG